MKKKEKRKDKYTYYNTSGHNSKDYWKKDSSKFDPNKYKHRHKKNARPETESTLISLENDTKPNSEATFASFNQTEWILDSAAISYIYSDLSAVMKYESCNSALR